jgi:hypothetical protein
MDWLFSVLTFTSVSFPVCGAGLSRTKDVEESSVNSAVNTIKHSNAVIVVMVVTILAHMTVSLSQVRRKFK